ncbi:CDP-alcohol phosphatidyltransferase family protein [Spiribacter vilamensis]|uniref:Phosphatidylglycerophosphate synthase n=1 Tax=Spiribacter vilamensis TaxID=531306 RepID=A0A4V2GIY9_9GAMM|nr:CDP-alcohol phosphatidyltransferase family protein [Spiribacter vilamensis]RZU98305.1 phosphatidylglycerophosphate synthase [Spiribacter vilamensis]TVO60805.1 CDP-alcohol phosphatidyltransferase family protein [Spiribacter vilamensis]
MLDAALQPLQHRILVPMARQIVARGGRADTLTLTGFALGLGALPLIMNEAYFAALVLIMLNRLMDGLDGEVARLTTPTDRGAFLDIALDFFFYATIPLAFAIADPAGNALAAAVVITSFVGTGSSFLAFAVIAEKHGLPASAYTGKGIHYLSGLTEGTETVVFLIAICVFPGYFAEIAYGFAIACLITTFTRWAQGMKAFGGTGAAS